MRTVRTRERTFLIQEVLDQYLINIILPITYSYTILSLLERAQSYNTFK